MVLSLKRVEKPPVAGSASYTVSRTVFEPMSMMP